MAVATAVLVAGGADLRVAISVLSLTVVCASVLGYAPGIAAAVVCFGALNYYFTQPLHSFAIYRTDDLIALVVSVTIAMIVGAVVARLNKLRVRARLGEREALVRLTFINRLVAGAEPSEVLDSAARELVTLFDLASCEIVADEASYRAVGERTQIESRSLGGGAFRVELGLGRALDAGEVRTVEALVASLASALERIRLDSEAREHELRGELDRSRASLLTAVTHDLRTPLAAIKAGTSAALVDDWRLAAADRRKVLEVAHDESARLERLIGKVLELTRIRAGGMSPEPIVVGAADLVRVAVQRLGGLTDERRVLMDIDPDLPALWVDPAMIERALVNLLENALRYGSMGSPVEVRAVRAGAAMELRIVDHGEGIPIGDRDRVFEEFVRLGSNSGSGGTGLGLAIVRAFVEVGGGRVWHEATPGGGATFAVSLPVVTEEIVS